MRARLIINPVSGDDEPNTGKVSAIQSWLARGPFLAEVAYTAPDRTAGQLAREAVELGMEIVLVGGGDGTVSEAARELVHTPATLGILPIGTFNNIARSVGIPHDLPAACGIITQGHHREIDVGLANNSRFFFEAAGAGLDATLFPIGEEIKGGRWTRVLQAARLTLQYGAQPFEITFDRSVEEALPSERKRRRKDRALRLHQLRRRALLVVVANGPYYGGGYTVAPDARLSDGRLTLSVYRRFSKWELIRHFQSISRGRYNYHPKIETYFATELTVASPTQIPVHVDGQPFGHTPISLRAVPGALRVFAPERAVQVGDDDPPVALPAPADASKKTEKEETKTDA